ncbi:MAG: hypothetical protein MMC23_004878 [Stictis urceolatum]|nr:hypothetical protein [Stictis urceolata]
MAVQGYSPPREAQKIFNQLCSIAGDLQLPESVQDLRENVKFTSEHDHVYFPIPFKETETAAALKALEATVAVALLEQKKKHSSNRTNGVNGVNRVNGINGINGTSKLKPEITISMESATSFLFQAYQATVDGLGKLDAGVKAKLKDTDLLQAQSNPYRRMSANLYRTADPGAYYHIHGSLEASTTLRMLSLEPFRPNLTSHSEIVRTIETAVRKHTVAQLEELNLRYRQAGIPALTQEQFLATPQGKTLSSLPPWTIKCLDDTAPPAALPPPSSSKPRILEGVKVLELCRIIAGPTITRILAEYGATILKITSPSLSDVPFFQVDGNMGKRCADLDLKTPNGRKVFNHLLADADVLVDGYRPGALDKLGYGPTQLAELGKRREKGYVYVSEDCHGFEGEWKDRAGWQQIADCVTGLAWAQGRFMGADAPVVPPFPISDYGTGCMGAIAALTGLYWRAEKGGSWWGGVSLTQYDLLLMNQGEYDEDVMRELKGRMSEELKALRYHDSVDTISGTTLKWMRGSYPWLFAPGKHTEKWYSQGYRADIEVVKPAVEIEGVQMGFQRASRPNGSDEATWDGP